ncbi:MAG TPA: DUF6587 family protein [Rhodanobacter sp.]
MSTFELVQGVVIGLVVTLSAWQAFRKLLPQTSRRLLARASARLDRNGRGGLTRRLGRWLQPAEASSGGCGSGGGCASCGGCAPVKLSNQVEPPQPLQFRARL